MFSKFMNMEQFYEVYDLVKELLREYALFYSNPKCMTVRSVYIYNKMIRDTSRSQEADIINEEHPEAVTCAHFEIGTSASDVEEFPDGNDEKVFCVDIMTVDTTGSSITTGGWYKSFDGEFYWGKSNSPTRRFQDVETAAKVIAEDALDFLTE